MDTLRAELYQSQIAVFSIIISSFDLAYFAYPPFLRRISAVNLKEAGKFLNLLEDVYRRFTT